MTLKGYWAGEGGDASAINSLSPGTIHWAAVCNTSGNTAVSLAATVRFFAAPKGHIQEGEIKTELKKCEEPTYKFQSLDKLQKNAG